MKVIIKLLIITIFIGVGNYLLAQDIESLKILKEERFNLKKEGLVFDYSGKLVGKSFPTDEVESA